MLSASSELLDAQLTQGHQRSKDELRKNMKETTLDPCKVISAMYLLASSCFIIPHPWFYKDESAVLMFSSFALRSQVMGVPYGCFSQCTWSIHGQVKGPTWWFSNDDAIHLESDMCPLSKYIFLTIQFKHFRFTRTHLVYLWIIN